ncbi:hypothetical protein DY000_02014422 [Brassica cretica]|uniref:PI-PLC Y-box domain-containing protein n=1 Tax=Brassica cretica TaxID=69181 RepID=A0ABQ7CR91_BRACR|nr:hypothetical protein DY000_02014422 [Brassica cretica]
MSWEHTEISRRKGRRTDSTLNGMNSLEGGCSVEPVSWEINGREDGCDPWRDLIITGGAKDRLRAIEKSKADTRWRGPQVLSRDAPVVRARLIGSIGTWFHGWLGKCEDSSVLRHVGCITQIQNPSPDGLYSLALRSTQSNLPALQKKREYTKLLSEDALYRPPQSNYRPLIGWTHGAQMIAFNMQGYGKSLWLMHGMFRANGGSGYVKKPNFLMKKGFHEEVLDPRKKLPVKYPKAHNPVVGAKPAAEAKPAAVAKPSTRRQNSSSWTATNHILTLAESLGFEDYELPAFLTKNTLAPPEMRAEGIFYTTFWTCSPSRIFSVVSLFGLVKDFLTKSVTYCLFPYLTWSTITITGLT